MRLIDADAVAEALNDEITYAKQISANSQTIMGLKMGLAYINTATTIDATPVRYGVWVHERRPSTSGASYDVVRCSACRWEFPMLGPKFCPHCGAKMDEENGR